MRDNKEAVADAIRMVPGVESVRVNTRTSGLESFTEWHVRGNVSAGAVRKAVETAFEQQGYYETDIKMLKERDGTIVVRPGGASIL